MDAVLDVRHGTIEHQEVYLEIPPDMDRAEWLGLVKSWLWSYGIPAGFSTVNYGLIIIGTEWVPCGYGYTLRCWLTPDNRGEWDVFKHGE